LPGYGVLGKRYKRKARFFAVFRCLLCLGAGAAKNAPGFMSKIRGFKVYFFMQWVIRSIPEFLCLCYPIQTELGRGFVGLFRLFCGEMGVKGNGKAQKN
jgi:hypothetical protein